MCKHNPRSRSSCAGRSLGTLPSPAVTHCAVPLYSKEFKCFLSVSSPGSSSAGWIGSKIMKTDAQQGIFLNIVVGVIGGLIGGFLLRVFGVDVEGAGWIFSFLTCLLGAVILLFLVKAVTGKR